MANAGEETMITETPLPYSRSQSQEEKFRKEGLDLFFGLGRALHDLHGNGDHDKPASSKSSVAITRIEREICGFRCVSRSILRHPSVWHMQSSNESNLVTVRITAVLAYLHFFQNTSPVPIMDLARTVCLNPSHSAVLEIRRIIGLLVVEGVVKIPENCGNPICPHVYLSPFIQKSLLGGDRALADLSTVPTVQTQQHERLIAKIESQKRVPKTSVPGKQIPSPQQIYTALRTEVFGQDEACRVMAIRGFMHLKRAEILRTGAITGFNQVAFLSGKSGTGKTWLANRFGHYASNESPVPVPFCCMDTTQCTAGGYVGLDIVEDAVRMLIRASGVQQSQDALDNILRYGAICYDEASKKKSNQGTGLDVGGKNVQYELLKFIEGSKVVVGNRYAERSRTSLEFNSDGTMFMFAGCLDGIQDIIARLKRKKSAGLGFNADTYVPKQGSYLYDAMVEFGFIPELINRLTAIIPFQPLTSESLRPIIQRCIDDFNDLWCRDGLIVSISQEAAKQIAEFCAETDLMARGCRLVISELCQEVLFDGRKGSLDLSAGVDHAIEKVCNCDGLA